MVPISGFLFRNLNQKSKKRMSWVVVLITLILAGCSTWPVLPVGNQVHEPPGIQRPASSDSVHAVLDYYRYAHALNGPAFAREVAYMSALVAHRPSDAARIELAMLDLMPAGAGPAKARIVLKPVKQEDSRDEMGNLADMLYDYAGSTMDATNKWRDEQRRNAVLEGKLNALKNLEINLMEPNR